MSKYKADIQTVIDFKGKRYDVETFANAFAEGNIENAIGAMEVLLNKGSAKLVVRNTKESKTFERIEKEESWSESADQHDMFVEANKDYLAQARREGKATYAQVEFDFGNLLKAQQFQSNMVKDLRIQDTEISLRSGVCVVIFREVTDAELNYMNRVYKADKVVNATVGTVNNVAEKATGAVHYGATKIVAPVVQVGARAGASIFKTLLTTSAKTAGSLISATAQGVRSAAHEIRHDEDVLRAGRDLIQVKDGVARKITNMGSHSGSGARIIG